ncbi:MAG: ribosome silencing factor [Kiritimatiellae bacterium]|nr:ribosome silencing factor [Kiritimatiellia bacterium]
MRSKSIPAEEIDAKKLALRCREIAEAKKAEDVVILDMRKLTSVTDYFVIATGTSEPHLRALLEEITERVEAEFGVQPRAVDGTLRANWVVLDYWDVVVHLMRAETREKYGLEILWGDAPRVRRSRARVSPLTETPATKSKNTRQRKGVGKNPAGTG